MKQPYALLLLAALFLTACVKDEDEPTPPSTPPTTCGAAGARLQAAFDGAAWCATASLFASDGAGVLTISGMAQQGSTLSLEIEDVFVGTHPLNDTNNMLLFTTNMAMGYATTDDDPGTLTINSHNTETKRIQGTFSANLYNSLGGPSKPITGNFDMFYVD